MALISMCCFDTEANQRTKFTEKTLACVKHTVDLSKHRVIIVDNGSCKATKNLLDWYRDCFTIITLPENIGTARAINKAWKYRLPEENCVKMDNDVVINQSGWVDLLEEAIARAPKIGIVGLKRKDCLEHPECPNEWYKSILYFLPHNPGESWIPFEQCAHVMGTCQMYSAALLKRIGYLNQPGIYGFDDSLASFRSHLAGFKNGFLPAVQIDYIDPGDNPYQKEKERLAGNDMAAYNMLCQDYVKGVKDIYYEDPE